MRPSFTTAATFATAAALLALGGCAIIIAPDDGHVRYESVVGSSGVSGNGNVSTENRSVEAADRLDLEGPLQVEVRVGPAPSLHLEGDSNLLPLVHADARDGNLRIWVDRDVRPKNDLLVVYTTPRLAQLNSSGSGRLIVTGLNGGSLNVVQNGSRGTQLSGRIDRLDVRVNGSGSVNASALDTGSVAAAVNGSGGLDLGQLRGDELNAEVRGSGSLRASGKVRAAHVKVYGSGSADLAALHIDSADLQSRGSGGITAAVAQTLAAEATGSGRITVYGQPAQRSAVGRGVRIIE